MPSASSPGHADGFTLVEVLFAIAIAVSTIVLLAQVLVAAGRTNMVARTLSVAARLAADKMESLRALPFDDPSLALVGWSVLQADVDGHWDEPEPGYRRRWASAALPSLPWSADAIGVAVVVERTDGASRAQLVTVRTRRTP